jgi:hypothetical protein
MSGKNGNGTKPRKSAQKSVRGIPFQRGPDPRRGRGPAPGAPNAGRPPNWLKDWCDELLSDETTKKQVRAILNDADHPAFRAMWNAVADRAHGKPKESLELSGKVTLEQILAGSYE